MRTRSLLAFLVTTAACGDGGGRPAEIMDTSGAPFAWLCTDQCRPEIEEGTPPLPPCNSGAPLYSWDLDRFINISAACTTSSGGWISEDNLSRPLACDSTADCPQFTGHAYECRNAICQNSDLTTYPAEHVTWEMADELCYATLQRGDTIDPTGPAALQVSMWVTAACPSMAADCALPLPSACLQP